MNITWLEILIYSLLCSSRLITKAVSLKEIYTINGIVHVRRLEYQCEKLNIVRDNLYSTL